MIHALLASVNWPLFLFGAANFALAQYLRRRQRRGEQ